MLGKARHITAALWAAMFAVFWSSTPVFADLTLDILSARSAAADRAANEAANGAAAMPVHAPQGAASEAHGPCADRHGTAHRANAAEHDCQPQSSCCDEDRNFCPSCKCKGPEWVRLSGPVARDAFEAVSTRTDTRSVKPALGPPRA